MNISDNEGVMILVEQLQASAPTETFTPRYNVAPSMQILCVAEESDPASTAPTGRHCRSFEWGLIPRWAKPGTFKSPLINARGETVWEKPSFRDAVKKGRVVIPVTGFYEWKREGKSRSAYHVTGPELGPLAFAGVSSVSKEGVPQVAVVTIEAGETMAAIHHRQPVLVDGDSAQTWLSSDDRDELNALMQTSRDQDLQLTAVGDYVNNARNEGPECVAPLGE